MKELLTYAPIQKILYPDKEYVVCTNASLEGLYGVLMQDGYVICYESRKWKEHEKNYDTHDLELASIVHALRMWRHYLTGSQFELKTYHHSLKNVFEEPHLNVR